MRWVQHGDTTFLWPLEINPEQYDSFRAAGDEDDDRRAIDEIAPEEIIAAAIYVLRHQVSLPIEALVRETALALGYERCGQPIQRAIGAAIELAERRKKVSRDGGGRVQPAH
jgi:hypothetical protein